MRPSRGGFSCRRDAGVAQLVEQRIRNAKVGSSTLLAGTIDAQRPVTTGVFCFSVGMQPPSSPFSSRGLRRPEALHSPGAPAAPLLLRVCARSAHALGGAPTKP